MSTAPKDNTAAQILDVDYEGEDAEAEEAMQNMEKVAHNAAPDIVSPTDIDKELHSFEVDPAQASWFNFNQIMDLYDYYHAGTTNIQWNLMRAAIVKIVQ